MIANRYVRNLLGLLLGGLAGFSFTVSVLPQALAWGRVGQLFALGRYLVPLWPGIVAVWALGGLGVVRTGAALPGGIVLAVVGMATGIAAAWLAFGFRAPPLLFALLAGALYGFVGGLILGRILAVPPPIEEDS